MKESGCTIIITGMLNMCFTPTEYIYFNEVFNSLHIRRPKKIL